MLRYRLDDLGAYQFEKPTQSSLKALVGLGVESGGNRGDWGRESSTPGSLRSPEPKSRQTVHSSSQRSLWRELPQEQNPILPGDAVGVGSRGCGPYQFNDRLLSH